MFKPALVGIAFLFATGAGAAADQPVSVELVLRTSQTIAEQQIELPQGPVEVTGSIFTIQPGASLPVHRHAFARYGYMLAGELTVSNQETGKKQTFHAGDMIVESIGKWHSGSNSGQVPVKLFVLDQAPMGAQTTEVKD